MNVWRKQTTQWILNGKRVASGTKKAKRKVIESKRFYGTLKTALGKTKQVPLTEDRESSQTLLRRLQTDEDTKRANGADRYHDERRRPVGELLASYADHLKAKGNCDRYVTGAFQRIRKLLDATKAKTLDDIEASRILKTLHAWRSRKRPMGITTSNDYLIAIKCFSRWLWTERKSPDDPLAGLRRMNAETDRRHVRRPFTPAELASITDVTQISPRTYRGDDWQLTPTDRTMLYLIAAYTGLRASELASLTKSSFDMENGTFTIEATYAKNRKRTTLPLHPSLAERLKTWFVSLKREALFPGSWAKRKRAGKVLHRDMKKANIVNHVNGTRAWDLVSGTEKFLT